MRTGRGGEGRYNEAVALWERGHWIITFDHIILYHSTSLSHSLSLSCSLSLSNFDRECDFVLVFMRILMLDAPYK